jgi:hypothetical protein
MVVVHGAARYCLDSLTHREAATSDDNTQLRRDVNGEANLASIVGELPVQRQEIFSPQFEFADGI